MWSVVENFANCGFRQIFFMIILRGFMVNVLESSFAIFLNRLFIKILYTNLLITLHSSIYVANV